MQASGRRDLHLRHEVNGSGKPSLCFGVKMLALRFFSELRKLFMDSALAVAGCRSRPVSTCIRPCDRSASFRKQMRMVCGAVGQGMRAWRRRGKWPWSRAFRWRRQERSAGLRCSTASNCYDYMAFVVIPVNLKDSRASSLGIDTRFCIRFFLWPPLKYLCATCP